MRISGRAEWAGPRDSVGWAGPRASAGWAGPRDSVGCGWGLGPVTVLVGRGL